MKIWPPLGFRPAGSIEIESVELPPYPGMDDLGRAVEARDVGEVQLIVDIMRARLAGREDPRSLRTEQAQILWDKLAAAQQPKI